MYKETIYTEEELANIEKLASKYNFKDMSEQLGLKENHFLKLRKNHPEFSKAVDRGVQLRGAEYKNKYRKKMSEASKRGKNEHKVQIGPPKEIDSKEALKKFKEQFEANKRKRDLEELKNLDLI